MPTLFRVLREKGGGREHGACDAAHTAARSGKREFGGRGTSRNAAESLPGVGACRGRSLSPSSSFAKNANEWVPRHRPARLTETYIRA